MQWWAAKGWALPSQPVATPLVLVFVSGTMFWLFFPLICRDEGEECCFDTIRISPHTFYRCRRNAALILLESLLTPSIVVLVEEILQHSI
jgi:hypothetical protein